MDVQSKKLISMTRHRAISFRPPPALLEIVDARAAELGVTRHDLLVRLVAAGLEGTEALRDEVRDEYREELRRRLKGFV